MNYRDALQNIEETVQAGHESSPISSGKITSTTLGRDDNGYFASFLSRDEEETIHKEYFSPSVNDYLEKLVSYTEEHCSLRNQSNLSTQLVLFIEEEPELYVHTSADFQLETDVLNPYISEFTTEDSSVNDVREDNITKLEITYSPIWSSFDSTCYYQTKKPHERYSNIESLDEYIDRMSDQAGVTESELRDKEYYMSHYHPHKTDVFSQIRTDCLSELSELYDMPESTFEVQPTKIVIRKDEVSEVCLTDISKGSVVNNQL